MSTALTTAPSAVPTAPPGGMLAAVGNLPARKTFTLLAALAVLASIVVASFMWTKNADYRVLYANLSDRDGGAVIAALSQMNVPYKFSEAGGAILVPADKVHDARLKLASQGLPKGSIVGFELMENPKFGMTQFQEKLNFQRGLEGELARSIQSLAAVAAARVHLALPNQSGFFREQQKPSASVLLTLHPGRTLDRAQVAGIVHLVASSVPELAPGAVSVIDQTGTLLSGQTDGVNANGLDPTQLQYVRQIEQANMKRIVDILEPLVGAGNVRAQVTAEVDFSQTESTAELYKPNQGNEPAAVRSQQVSEAGNGGAGPQGVPGALSNQPPTPATAPVNGANPAPHVANAAAGANGANARREAVTNYEVDKTVRVTRNAVGNVKRLTAAVVINHKKVVDKSGKVTYVPIPAAQMESINALVREAVGFSKDRGDSINVVNAPFSVEEVEKAPEVPLWKDPENIALAKDVGMQTLLVILGVLVIFGVIRPTLKSLSSRPRPAAGATITAVVDGPESLPPAAVGQPLKGVDDVRRLAKENPATVANVVRAWVSNS